MTYALTSRGDLKRRLEYAFELYDTNHDNALEVDEVREIIYGILELFDKQSIENLVDVSKDCFKHMKITQVVKKS
jgi:Ca2+-binding EF-hand superfamily protein